MAANPGIRIENGILKSVSNDHIEKNNGHLEVPSSVTTIGFASLANRTSLKQVIIPNSVTGIGHNVFNHCTSLKKITIHDSVKYIRTNAFINCPEDLEITIIASDPYAEKAEVVKAMLPEEFRNNVKIEFSPEANQGYVKGDSSSPAFFSQPSEQQEDEPSSNNQNKPGA